MAGPPDRREWRFRRLVSAGEQGGQRVSLRPGDGPGEKRICVHLLVSRDDVHTILLAQRWATALPRPV